MFIILHALNADYFLDPADLAALQPDLDAMGMGVGFCQDVPDYTPGQLTRALVLLQYYADFCSGFDVRPSCSIHISLAP